MTHLVMAVKTTEGGMWLIPHILEARRRSIRVTVITPAGEGRLVRALRELITLDAGIAHSVSPFDFSFRRPWRAVAGLWKLRRLVRGLRPTTLLYHLYATALAMRLATVGLKMTKIYMVAGPLYLDSRIVSLAERVLAKRDDLIICGSEHTQGRYRRLGIPADRLTTIAYGVDTMHFKRTSGAGPGDVRPAFGLSTHAFVVVMVAFVYAPKTLVYNGEGIKGHRQLLEVWQSFRAAHPDAELLLVGSGFDQAGEAYRQELMDGYFGTSQKLTTHGIYWMTSVEDVRNAYVAADISVSPSLSENHGAALEASSMGVPSIVSDAGGLPETVTDQSGWIFPAGSSAGLSRCLEESYAEWQRGSLGLRGMRARQLMIERFDVTQLAGRVVDEVVV